MGVTKWCWIFLLALGYFISNAQITPDTSQVRRESKIDALFSFYGQNGNHSAVTGGKGDENLQVYSSMVNYSSSKAKNTYYLNLGVDVISSASTDSIDFEVSSASRVDQHTSMSLGYARQIAPEYTMGVNLLLSLESDYFSRGGEAWLSYLRKDQRASANFSFSAFFDDLRWGRLQPPYIIEARNLVYPIELRDSNWFDIYHRNSYNFSASYRYDLNKKMSLGIFPAYTYQEGLLSTPFHRIYFEDQITLVVENLPGSKHMAVLGAQLNSFIGTRMILRAYAQYYADNFGVKSTTIKLETPYKLRPNFSLSPSIRLSVQEANRYFAPYKKHNSSENYYTSDYDLSGFWAVNAGINFNLIRLKATARKWRLPKISVRYSYYYREDGLNAHIISTYWGLEKLSKTNKSSTP